MPPKGRKGTSAITKDEKVEKIDSDGDNEKDTVETKQSPSTKPVSKEEDEEASNDDVVDSGDENVSEKKRDTKKKSYKEESDEETVPKKRVSQRSTKPKGKLVDVSDEFEEEEDEEESEDEYVPPASSPRGRGRGQKKRKGDESDDSGSYGKKAKRSKKPKRKPKRKDDSDFSEDDDSDEDWGSSKKSKSKGTPRGRKASTVTPTRRGERATRGRQKVHDYAEEEDEESDSPAPKSKGKAKSEDKSEQGGEVKSEGGDEHEASDIEEVKDADSKQANGRKDRNKAVDNENGMVEEPDEEEDDDKEGSKPAVKRKGEKAEKTPAKKVKEHPDLSTVDFSCDKETPDGKPWNIKISSWNVAGLRALIKKNGLEYLTAENPDILCLQEIKCPEKKLPPETKVEGYHTYWSSGDKDGHNGIGIYTKEKPLEVTYSIGDSEFDTEGRLITAEYEKFYLVNAYVPNSGRGLVTLPKRMKWDTEFREYLKKLDEKKPVILCGDLNVSHQAIDLANPKTNTKNAGFTQEERDGFTKLLDEGFIDSFRQLYPEKTDAYTFWTNMKNARERNVGWRLDYFVLSKRLVPNLCENSIRSQVYGSDHCPVTLFINI